MTIHLGNRKYMNDPTERLHCKSEANTSELQLSLTDLSRQLTIVGLNFEPVKDHVYVVPRKHFFF